MKAFAVVCLLAVAAVAIATETETDEGVPTLPGLGSPCLPNRAPVNVRWQHRFEKPAPLTFRGQCTKEASCSPLNTVHGYCAGMGVVCCKGGGSIASIPNINNLQSTIAAGPARPSLQATATPAGCAAVKGSCIPTTACMGTTISNLCPGTPNNVKCCVPKVTIPSPLPPTNPPTGTLSMSQLIAIPAANAGLQFPSASFQTGLLGRPGCPLTAACFGCTCSAGSRIQGLVQTLKVTDTVSVTGVRPFVAAIKAAFDAMAASGKADAIQARREVKSAGGLCCRAIKRPNGTPSTVHSNHSWGLAVDFYFGSDIDPRGDGKTQRGLAIMAPYFNAQGLYWAGGYSGSTEDAMHFEASVGKLNQWRAAKLI